MIKPYLCKLVNFNKFIMMVVNIYKNIIDTGVNKILNINKPARK